MQNNSNKKTKGLIYVQKMSEKQICPSNKINITTELQAPDLGQAHT